MKSLVFTLLAVVALASASEEESITEVPAADLRDAKLCAEGKECLFTANMTSDSTEDAMGAKGNIHPEKNDHSIAMAFSVQSHCGVEDVAFFKLIVTQYQLVNHPQEGHEQAAVLKENPCFFKTLRSDGTITDVVFGKSDPNFSRNIKQGIIHSLAKKIHPAKLQEAASSPAPVSYIFEGSDFGGKFRATHHISRKSPSRLLLLETKEYSPSLDETATQTRGETIQGQKMEMARTSLSSSELSEKGHVEDMDEKSEMKMGDDKESDPPAVYPTPSTGKTSMKNNFQTKRVGEKEFTGKCVSEAEMGQAVSLFEQNLFRRELGGDSHDSRAFRDPLKWEYNDLQHEDWYSPEEHTDMAISLLQQGEFSFNQLLKHVSENNVEKLAGFARENYADGKIPLRSMKAFVGALSTVRSRHSYHELLGILTAGGAALSLRQQALVSLLHPEGDTKPPKYVVDIVEDLSNSESDGMKDGALLLLGALLEHHSDSSYGKQKISKICQELAALDKNDEKTSFRAQLLINSLRNVGPSARRETLPRIAKFQNSKLKALRQIARAAVSDLNRNRFADRKTVEQKNLGNGELEARDSIVGREGEEEEDLLQEEELVDLEETPEDISQEDVNRTEGGRLAQVELKPVTGTKVTGISAMLTSGAEWDANQASAMGNVEMEAFVLNFKMKIMNIGASYALNKGVDISSGSPIELSPGKLTFTFTILGKTILQAEEQTTPADLVSGGQCPNGLKDTTRAQNRPKNEWYVPLFIFSMIFPIGPVPATITVTVGGRMGFELYGETDVNCAYNDKGGKLGVVGGFGPISGVDVVISASVNMACMKVGVEGTLMIIKGTLPSYGIANSDRACGYIDLKLEALGGQITGFSAILMVKKWVTVARIPILKWNGPQVQVHVAQQCKPVEGGHFPKLVTSHPTDSDKNDQDVATALYNKEINAEREEQEEDREKNRQKNFDKAVGMQALIRMRRAQERELGEMPEHRFGEGEDGWPWNEMSEDEKREYGFLPSERNEAPNSGAANNANEESSSNQASGSDNAGGKSAPKNANGAKSPKSKSAQPKNKSAAGGGKKGDQSQSPSSSPSNSNAPSDESGMVQGEMNYGSVVGAEGEVTVHTHGGDSNPDLTEAEREATAGEKVSKRLEIARAKLAAKRVVRAEQTEELAELAKKSAEHEMEMQEREGRDGESEAYEKEEAAARVVNRFASLVADAVQKKHHLVGLRETPQQKKLRKTLEKEEFSISSLLRDAGHGLAPPESNPIQTISEEPQEDIQDEDVEEEGENFENEDENEGEEEIDSLDEEDESDYF